MTINKKLFTTKGSIWSTKRTCDTNVKRGKAKKNPKITSELSFDFSNATLFLFFASVIRYTFLPLPKEYLRTIVMLIPIFHEEKVTWICFLFSVSQFRLT